MPNPSLYVVEVRGDAVTIGLPPPPIQNVVFGGAGMRGFPYLGGVQYLDEAEIIPERVAGSSAGALTAALYASGLSGEKMQGQALGYDYTHFVGEKSSMILKANIGMWALTEGAAFGVISPQEIANKTNKMLCDQVKKSITEVLKEVLKEVLRDCKNENERSDVIRHLVDRGKIKLSDVMQHLVDREKNKLSKLSDVIQHLLDKKIVESISIIDKDEIKITLPTAKLHEETKEVEEVVTFSQMHALHEYFQEHPRPNCPDCRFKDLYILGTEVTMQDGKPQSNSIVFSHEHKDFKDMPVAIAVECSMAAPGVFHHVNYKGRIFIDGAVTEKVPDIFNDAKYAPPETFEYKGSVGQNLSTLRFCIERESKVDFLFKELRDSKYSKDSESLLEKLEAATIEKIIGKIKKKTGLDIRDTEFATAVNSQNNFPQNTVVIGDGGVSTIAFGLDPEKKSECFSRGKEATARHFEMYRNADSKDSKAIMEVCKFTDVKEIPLNLLLILKDKLSDREVNLSAIFPEISDKGIQQHKRLDMLKDVLSSIQFKLIHDELNAVFPSVEDKENQRQKLLDEVTRLLSSLDFRSQENVVYGPGTGPAAAGAASPASAVSPASGASPASAVSPASEADIPANRPSFMG